MTAEPTTERPALTARQAAILKFIVAFWGRHGATPTIRELCAAFDISSPNGIVCHLKPIAAKGYIRFLEGDAGHSAARGIVVPELLAGAKALADQYLSTLTGGQS